MIKHIYKENAETNYCKFVVLHTNSNNTSDVP